MSSSLYTVTLRIRDSRESSVYDGTAYLTWKVVNGTHQWPITREGARRSFKFRGSKPQSNVDGSTTEVPPDPGGLRAPQIRQLCPPLGYGYFATRFETKDFNLFPHSC